MEIRRGRGAYGLRISGLDGMADLLVEADDWPSVAVEHIRRAPMYTHERVGPDDAEILLRTGGGFTLRRQPGRATFLLPQPIDAAALLHPYLAPAAALYNWWLRRDALHAGGLVAGGGAWGIIGEREAGKSTTLAWLALHGSTIVADDLLVVAGGTAFTGPRAVDLRPDAAARLGAGEPMGVLGARERWRLRLGPAPPTVSLRGWVVLAWGDEVALRRVRLADRLQRLAQQRLVYLPSRDPVELLELARLPAWEWVRPRLWSRMAEATARLLDALER